MSNAASNLRTEERITNIFVEVLNVERPSPDTDLITGGLLDSLALVTLLFEIEQEFAVQLSLESLDIEALRDVRRIAVLIDELMAGRVGPSSAARSHRQ